MKSATFVLRLSLAFSCVQLASVAVPAWTQNQNPAAPADSSSARPRAGCRVGNAPPSDADKALSRKDYSAAVTLFQKLQASSPDVSRAGIIRTLIAEGKVPEASSQAKDWLQAEPASGPAMEMSAEVLFREGELPDALKTALDSRKLDPCSARALLLIAHIEHLLGNHATAARLITTAHLLSPQDIEVQQAWGTTQRRSQRAAIAATAAKDEQLLNADDRKKVLESLAHEKDYSENDCQIAKPVDHAEMHLEEMMGDANHRNSFGLYVKLNGSQRTLELDSGASGLVLSRGAAARLGLAHGETYLSTGVGDEGGIQSAVAYVESVRIGGLEFKHCPVTIFEKGDKLGIDGLIGTDVFEKYLVTLDFPARKLRLDPLPKRPGETDSENAKVADDAAPVFQDRYIAPEMKDWTMIWRDGHFLLLPVSIGAAKDKLLLIDTGASSMLISPAAAREVTKVHGDFDTHMFGVSGEVKHVYQTQEFLVSFGQVRLHVDSMAAVDTESLSKGAGFEISGLLGAPVLNRLVLQIDYRDNLVHLGYDAKKDPQNLPPTPFY